MHTHNKYRYTNLTNLYQEHGSLHAPNITTTYNQKFNPRNGN